MADAKAQVIERIDELIVALAKYEERCGMAIELIVRPDGTCTLMGDTEGEALAAHEKTMQDWDVAKRLASELVVDPEEVVYEPAD